MNVSSSELEKFLPDREAAIKNLRIAIVCAILYAVAVMGYNFFNYGTFAWGGIFDKAKSIGANLLGGAVFGAGFLPGLHVVEALYGQLFVDVKLNGVPLHESSAAIVVKALVVMFSAVFGALIGMFVLPASMLSVYLSAKQGESNE